MATPQQELETAVRHCAAGRDDRVGIGAALGKGADPNRAMSDGRTPLSVLCKSENGAAIAAGIAMLRHWGGRAQVRDNEGTAIKALCGRRARDSDNTTVEAVLSMAPNLKMRQAIAGEMVLASIHAATLDRQRMEHIGKALEREGDKGVLDREGKWTGQALKAAEIITRQPLSVLMIRKRGGYNDADSAHEAARVLIECGSRSRDRNTRAAEITQDVVEAGLREGVDNPLIGIARAASPEAGTARDAAILALGTAIDTNPEKIEEMAKLAQALAGELDPERLRSTDNTGRSTAHIYARTKLGRDLLTQVTTGTVPWAQRDMFGETPVETGIASIIQKIEQEKHDEETSKWLIQAMANDPQGVGQALKREGVATKLRHQGLTRSAEMAHRAKETSRIRGTTGTRWYKVVEGEGVSQPGRTTIAVGAITTMRLGRDGRIEMSRAGGKFKIIMKADNGYEVRLNESVEVENARLDEGWNVIRWYDKDLMCQSAMVEHINGQTWMGYAGHGVGQGFDDIDFGRERRKAEEFAQNTTGVHLPEKRRYERPTLETSKHETTMLTREGQALVEAIDEAYARGDRWALMHTQRVLEWRRGGIASDDEGNPTPNATLAWDGGEIGERLDRAIERVSQQACREWIGMRQALKDMDEAGERPDRAIERVSQQACREWNGVGQALKNMDEAIKHVNDLRQKETPDLFENERKKVIETSKTIGCEMKHMGVRESDGTLVDNRDGIEVLHRTLDSTQMSEEEKLRLPEVATISLHYGASETRAMSETVEGLESLRAAIANNGHDESGVPRTPSARTRTSMAEKMYGLGTEETRVLEKAFATDDLPAESIEAQVRENAMREAGLHKEANQERTIRYTRAALDAAMHEDNTEHEGWRSIVIAELRETREKHPDGRATSMRSEKITAAAECAPRGSKAQTLLMTAAQSAREKKSGMDKTKRGTQHKSR